MRRFLILLAFCLGPSVWGQVQVTEEAYNPNRTAANLAETNLATANVSASSFGKLFSQTVDGSIFAQPLYLQNVPIAGKGAHNVVYVATMANTVYAFDSDANQPALWSANFGAPVTTHTETNIPAYGILSTPYIDAANFRMYFVTYTTESSSEIYRLHVIDIRSGAELLPSVVIAGSAAGVTFDPNIVMQRPALAAANGHIIVAFGSFADLFAFHGWIFSYDTSFNKIGVFCVTPTGEDGGIWMTGRGPVVDANGNIYFETGNGTYDGVSNFGDSFIKLNNSLTIQDWFTPADFSFLDSGNRDLGASGALLVPGTTTLVGGGKEGVLYLVNSQQMGKEWMGNSQIIQSFSNGSGAIFSSGVFNSATSLFYLWADGGLPIYAYHFNGTTLDTTPVARSTILGQAHSYAGSLAISANANTPGSAILWATMPSTPNNYDGNENPGILRAFDASTLTELWNSSLNPFDSLGLWSKFRSPVVANGKVYVGSIAGLNGPAATLSVYGLTCANAPPEVTNVFISLNVGNPPSIAQQPQSTAVTVGQKATFSVTATGLGLSYQWQQESPGASTFVNISGATSSSYTTGSAQLSDAGTSFRCIVSNTEGSVTSAAALLLVSLNTNQSTGGFVASSVLGTPRNNYSGFVGMALNVGNSPITVVALGRMVAPAHAETHLIKIVQASNGVDVSAGSVTVDVSSGVAGSFSYSSLSSPITLAANTSYYIVSQETLGGDGWYDYNTVVVTSTNASVVSAVYGNGSLYSTSGTAGQTYGPVDFLYYLPPPSAPAITQQPQSLTVYTTQAATFTVTASGPKLTYQWQIEPPGGTAFADIPEATSSTYTLLSAALSNSGSQYQCVVTNAQGSVTSTIANLTVTAAVAGTPFIVSNSFGVIRNDYSGYVGMQIVVGSSPVTVTSLGRIFAPGNNGTHQVKIVNASVGSDEDSGNFYWVNHPGVDVPSGTVTVNMIGGTVNSFVYTALPVPITLNANSPYYILTQENSSGDSWYDHDGTIAQTTSVATVTNAVFGIGSPYAIKNDTPGQVYGPVNFQYTLQPMAPSITQQPVNASVGLSSSATFSVLASGTNLSYQWQSLASGATVFTPIPGATNASYATPAVSQSDYGTQFQCVVSNSVGSVTSSSAILVAPPAGTQFVTSEVVGTIRNNFSGWVGMRITTGNSPLTISALGRLALLGNGGTHPLKLVDSTGNDVNGALTNVSIAGAAVGSFAYAALPAPVTLNANATYYVVSLETAGGDQWYDYNSSVKTTNVATASGAVYSSGTGYIALGSAGQSYGPVSFLY